MNSCLFSSFGSSSALYYSDLTSHPIKLQVNALIDIVPAGQRDASFKRRFVVSAVMNGSVRGSNLICGGTGWNIFRLVVLVSCIRFYTNSRDILLLLLAEDALRDLYCFKSFLIILDRRNILSFMYSSCKKVRRRRNLRPLEHVQMLHSTHSKLISPA